MAKASTPKNAVASKKEENKGIANFDALPEFMRGDIGKGQDRIEAEDIETPRIKLMQGLSRELESYNELRPGMFLHQAAEHIFKDGKFKAVPLYYDKRYILWNPLDSGGGILARADDGVHWNPPDTEFVVKLDKKDGGDTVKWKTANTVAQSGLSRWGSMNPNNPSSPPAATRMLNYVVAFPDHPELGPAVLTFQRSSIGMGRKFNSKLKTIRAPMFGCVFEFSAFKDKNKSGQEYYNLMATGQGLLTDTDLYEQYRDLNAQFTQAGLNVQDLEGMQSEDPTGADDGVDDDAEAGPKRGGSTGAGSRPRY